MSNPRIYIESCPIIDVIKGRFKVELEADRVNDIWHVEACLKAALAGEIEVVTSMLTIAEVRRARQEKPATEQMKRVIRAVLASGKVFHLAEVTQTIAESARDLEWEKNIPLKGADSVHVATAIRTGCKEFFTTDGRGPLKNAERIERVFGLKVIPASKTQLLPSDYRQATLPKAIREGGLSEET
jgi:predicted nucleic acid-binding protein